MLSIRDLKVDFNVDGQVVRVLHGIDLDIEKGETLGLVGESGCGKSVTCMAAMRLLGERAKITGRVNFNGCNILKLSDRKMENIRGKDLAMIFQDPVVSLNPVMKIGTQINEVLKLHGNYTKEESKKIAVSLLKKVGIASAECRLNDYPHQLSGGLCQRVMIAMALAGKPKILIADEPTTALDVTVQAQILELLRELNNDLDMATILVTHDLGVIAENVSRVMVMYAGVVVEEASVEDLFSNPSHPYTVGLLESLPDMENEGKDLIPIEGVVPAPDKRPSGCCFQPRCKRRTDECIKAQPGLKVVGNKHRVACFNPVGSIDQGGGNGRK